MSTQTKKERLGQLGRRYRTAGLEHKKKLIDQAVELLGYHRKAAIRALNTAPVARVGAITGRGARIQAGKIGLPEPSAVW